MENIEKTKDSFVFYRSFSDAMAELTESDQLELYRAIVGYGLDADMPEFGSPYLRMAWMLIKPQLDANWRKYKNGCKGGAPKGSRNNPNGRKGNKPRTNQELTKNKPNVNDNDNVNDNVNDNEDIKSMPDGTCVSVSPEFIKLQEWIKKELPHVAKMEQQITDRQLECLLRDFDKDSIFSMLREMDNYRKGGKSVEKCYNSVYRTLLNWLKRNDKKE